jgi:hypothetical protein
VTHEAAAYMATAFYSEERNPAAGCRARCEFI